MQFAFDFFNQELFSDELPHCLITFQRSRYALGFFMGDRFGCVDGKIADEIALNPRHFKHRTFEEVTSTLVHEMAHHWQHHFGKPGRGAYHNKEWARKMEWLGLAPFNVKDPNLSTGRRVSHRIIPGGRFQIAAEKLRATSFALSWFDADGVLLRRQRPENVDPNSHSGKRTKFVCPNGHVAAWAKPAASLLCGICTSSLQPQVPLLGARRKSA